MSRKQFSRTCKSVLPVVSASKTAVFGFLLSGDSDSELTGVHVWTENLPFTHPLLSEHEHKHPPPRQEQSKVTPGPVIAAKYKDNTHSPFQNGQMFNTVSLIMNL